MALQALRRKNQLILCKIETTYDTDPTPTEASNSILAYDIDFKENVAPSRRLAQVASLSRLPSVDGPKFAEVKFKVESKGSGTAGTAPRIGALIRACSCSETIVSNTSVTYKPRSTSQESCTIYFYIDGRLHKMTGCVGDFKLYTNAGEFSYYEFTMQGRYTVATLVALPTATLESTNPPIAKSCTFTYNSRTTLVLKSAIIEMNNVIAQRPSLNDANSIAGFIVTGRDPMATIDPEMTVETSYDFRTDALTTQRQISWVVGSTAGNILTITIPKFNPYFPEYSDRDEILVETIKGECTQNSGNDEVQLVYT